MSSRAIPLRILLALVSAVLGFVLPPVRQAIRNHRLSRPIRREDTRLNSQPAFSAPG